MCMHGLFSKSRGHQQRSRAFGMVDITEKHATVCVLAFEVIQRRRGGSSPHTCPTTATTPPHQVLVVEKPDRPERSTFLKVTHPSSNTTISISADSSSSSKARLPCVNRERGQRFANGQKIARGFTTPKPCLSPRDGLLTDGLARPFSTISGAKNSRTNTIEQYQRAKKRGGWRRGGRRDVVTLLTPIRTYPPAASEK